MNLIQFLAMKFPQGQLFIEINRDRKSLQFEFRERLYVINCCSGGIDVVRKLILQQNNIDIL